jgi:hypothetical protein
MTPAQIIALITVLEQLAASVYDVVQTSGLSEDDTSAYIARIQKAMAGVPEPKVGCEDSCDTGNCG